MPPAPSDNVLALHRHHAIAFKKSQDARRALVSSILKKVGVKTGTPFALRAKCPQCGSRVRQYCRTRSGEILRTSPHQRRIQAVRKVTTVRTSRLLILEDDPRFGLEAGDIVTAHPYGFDSAKWTVIAREADGFDPECNVYGNNTEWLGWAS